MDILFRNVLILADPSTGKVQKGELAVHEGTISYVGEKAPATTYDRVIEGENNLILPGFKNAHSHKVDSQYSTNESMLMLFTEILVYYG